MMLADIVPSRVAMERIRHAARREYDEGDVNIVFASDANYIKYTAVTLASLLSSYESDRKIRVFILVDGDIPEKDKGIIDNLKQIHEFDVSYIVVNASIFENIRTSAGISIATYYRLMMHNILPADIMRAIYLDSDLIIRASIDKLYDIDMEGCVFAGVEDSISKEYNKKFGIPRDGKHINAGVMLIDLGLVRSIGFDELVESYLSANRYRLVLGDQQLVAELFYHSIKYVPVQWNVHGSMFNVEWRNKSIGRDNCMSTDEVEQAVDDPFIIHYTLKRKPWISPEHPKSSEWYKYLSLTGYINQIDVPKTVKGNRDGDPSQSYSNPNPESISKRIKGYIRSLHKLRSTRLSVNKLERRFSAFVEDSKSSMTSVRPSGASLGTSEELKCLLLARRRGLSPEFNARVAFERLPEFSSIMSNVNQKDIDGGYAENIKTLCRTSNISFFKDRIPEAIILLSQRKNQQMFWDCLRQGFLYDRPIFFCEVALFGAFASYFDESATLNERRAFGFLVDDMGYYFDSRQPSRLEEKLNSSNWQLDEEQLKRSRRLIERVCGERITKYNKYTMFNDHHFDMGDNSVVVLDQKRGDASIEFAGANDITFERMLEAAVKENPGRTVYFKRHPDSIKQKMNSYRNRNIKEIQVLPDWVSIDTIWDKCEAIYTVSSQVGFEALLRGKKVVTFGVPFYAGWGLSDDRVPISRREKNRSIEELFYITCIEHSVYIDPVSGSYIDLEDAIDLILQMRISAQNHCEE